MCCLDKTKVSSGRIFYKYNKKDPEYWNTRGLITKLRSKIGVLARFSE
jgi:hypothetical protein